MTETINILKEELIHDNNSKLEHVHNHVCDGKLKASSLQCRNCYQLKNQLKETLNELSSVKLIAEILNEEIKSLKQTSNTDSNTHGYVQKQVTHMISPLFSTLKKLM